jgi:DNA repair exonuclease SbcCD ATPase subunit
MFAVKAAKRGVLFPILVNVVAVLVLAVGLAVFYFLFQRGETQLSQEDTGTITAEGKLLAEVKKESEAKLQEKNQQINDIQGRLAQIDKQRQDLQSNMDAKVQQKEGDLRAAMAAELDAEKARLQKQGLSDQDIQKKLADLEAQKNASFNKELDSFKTQADAERKQSEATLKDLQTQFNADLAKANTERQQVLSDSKQREADLQAQLATRTSELQAQAAQSQQQLTALTSQKTQEDLVSQQLVGLYSVAQTDIAARNYTKALASLQAIGSYVNSTDVATLPGMAKRRAVDQFIVDSLTQLVQGQIDASSADSASLVDAANKLADVRGKVADADTQLKAGKVADAERLYGQALAVLPEVAKSYAWFTAKSADTESSRQAALHAALTRAETAYAAGRFPEMLAAYKDALGALPETPARLDALLGNVTAAGAALAGQATQADQSRAAAALLSQGDTQLKQGSTADAAVSYLQLLQSYPQSPQGPQALQGISRAIAAMNAAAATDAKKQAATIAALNAQVASLQGSLVDGANEIRGVKKALMDLLGQSGDPARADTDQLLASVQAAYGNLTKAAGGSSTLQAQLDAAAKANRDNETKIAALTDTNKSLQQALQSAQAAQGQAERAARAAQAAQAAQTTQTGQNAQSGSAAATAPLGSADAQRLKKYDQLAESYRTYADQEGPLTSGAANAPDLRKTFGYRESFLQTASGVFDRLADRMHAYDNGFLSAGIAQGRDDTLKNVAAIVVNLARVTNAADQKKFFDEQIAAASNDKPLADYLRKLQSLMSAR